MKVSLYSFKTTGKVSDPYEFAHVEDFNNRSDARRAMNNKRGADKSIRYAVYEGKTLISSTF